MPGRGRRRSGQRSRSAPQLTTGSLLVLLAIFAFVFLMERGLFDQRLQPEPAAEATPGLPAAGTSAPADGAPQAAAPTPQAVETEALAGFSNGAVQVYFTRPRYPERRSERRGGLDETIAADIDKAQQSLDVASFDFDLPLIAAALRRAQERGVLVRVVVDGENLETPEVAQVVSELEDADIGVTVDQREAFMHNKFIVIDRAVVWTGSWNLTVNDTFRNDNNMLRLADARIADNYTRKFEALFGHREGIRTQVSIQYPAVDLGNYQVVTLFTPEHDVTRQVVLAIQQARERIDVLAFTFTSDPIADALIAAKGRGVQVRGVIETRNVRATGSEMRKLQASGLDVREDGNCYIMHHKVFVIDGRQVITGSFNWTNQAQQSNDENALVVDNPWLAERYGAEFERIYQQAVDPPQCGG